MRTLEQTTREVLDLAAKHFQLPAGSLAPEDDFFKKLGITACKPWRCFRAWRIISVSSCPITRFKA